MQSAEVDYVGYIEFIALVWRASAQHGFFFRVSSGDKGRTFENTLGP